MANDKKPQYQIQDQDPNVKELKQKFIAQIVEQVNKPENVDFKRMLCHDSGRASACGCDMAELSKGGLINCADIQANGTVMGGANNCKPGCSGGVKTMCDATGKAITINCASECNSTATDCLPK